jgi:hypothetical protein
VLDYRDRDRVLLDDVERDHRRLVQQGHPVLVSALVTEEQLVDVCSQIRTVVGARGPFPPVASVTFRSVTFTAE